METSPKVNHEDLTLNWILQRGIDKNLDDFLSRNIKLSKNKRRLRNVSKRKLSGNNQIPKIIAISSMDNLSKENLPISTFIPIHDKSVVDIVIIGADIYHAAYMLKGAQVFAVSMRDLEFQIGKEAKREIDPKSVVLDEYYDLLDVFSKKDSDTLLPHR